MTLFVNLSPVFYVVIIHPSTFITASIHNSLLFHTHRPEQLSQWRGPQCIVTGHWKCKSSTVPGQPHLELASDTHDSATHALYSVFNRTKIRAYKGHKPGSWIDQFSSFKPR